LQLQARIQADQAAANHAAQIQQQKAENDAIHQRMKAQTEVELAKVKAELEARMAVLDAHLKLATSESGKRPRSLPPGARQAQDGHHYVADAQRPGKFMRVVHHGQ